MNGNIREPLCGRSRKLFIFGFSVDKTPSLWYDTLTGDDGYAQYKTNFYYA